MSTEPLFWYRPRSDGGYEGPLHSGQIEDVRKASGAWVPLFAGAAPVSGEPVAWMTHHDEPMLFPTESEARSYCDDDEQPIPLYTAPVTAQPDLTQQTLDDVMAGIPARDAEIEALRKEVEALQTQQNANKVDALPPLNNDLIAILGRPNFLCAQLADTLRSGGQDIAKRAENEQAAVIHFLLGHYLADPAQWAEKANAAIDAARKEQA